MPRLLIAALLFVWPFAGRAALGPNLALHKPVEASGDVWATLSPVSLTDGDPNTFCHPLASSGTRDFHFQIDLGATYRLEEIRIRNRADGCCPERLTRYRVEVYADDSGETGALNWAAEVRADGSHSGVSGADVITAAANAQGTFAGRFVRVVNASGLGYSPQLAEVEVYGGVVPVILWFEAERDVLAAGESTVLRWQMSNGLGGTIEPGGFAVSPSGSLEVTPAQTTEYVLTATNVAGTTVARTWVGVDVKLDPPLITEFLAENERGARDEDRDESDWIELLNPNPFSLNLEGLALTDEMGSPAKWRFPHRKIPPGGRIVVFASGKDRAEAEGELHTNFRLSAEGEYLALVSSNGVVLQQFPRFPAQMADVSYGLGTNGASGFMRPATPGEANGFAFAGAVADTKFSPNRGFYTNKIWVAIETATPNATIRYTTDGSEPNGTRGNVYTDPIPVERTTVLRAAAFRPGWSPTDADTHSYIFTSSVITSAVMRTSITRHPAYAPLVEPGLRDIPSVSLASGETIDGTSEALSSMEWLPSDASEMVQENCGARLFGGAFTTFAKKNFRLYFRTRHGAPELRARLFEPRGGEIAPVEEFDQLELRGGSHDMEQRGFYLSNIFADDTLLAMKQLNPHGRFVHVYLNGVYWGVYHLRERWNADMHQSYLGGTSTNYESINGNWNVGGWAEPGTAYDGDGSAWERAKSLRGDYQALKPFLDVDQYADFMITWMFGGSEDEYRAVGPNGPGSGFKLYLNDADGWFCGPWYCAADNRTARSSPGRRSGDGPGSIFSMLLREGHPDYRTLLADRIFRALYNHGALTPAQNIARLSERTSEIERAFIAEAARWNYLSPAEWRARRDYAVTNWLPRRTAEVIGDFRAAGLYPTLAAPVLNQQGGTVAPGFELRFSTPRGVVYYTVDGSDPRLPGGALSPQARTGPAIITQNSIVKVRVRDGAQWSALNEAFFSTGGAAIAPGEILLAEVHYGGSKQATEFVELLNTSPRALDLSGVEIAGGIRFAFRTARFTALAPGQRMLLVRDLLRFQEKYGLDAPWAGIYQGRLSTDGEELALMHGTTRLGGLWYAPDRPWPRAGEHSLVLAHPALGQENPRAWRASAAPGGTPGGHDGTYFVGDPAADQDRDGTAALVEYAFGTSENHPDPAPSIEVHYDRTHTLTVRFPRRLGADDILLTCESSEDLLGWHPAEFLRSDVIRPGASLETWSATASGTNGLFVRVNIQKPNL